MELAEWLREFRALHTRAKQGSLGSPELADYRAARNELARVLLSAQRVAISPGQIPRRMLRAARALQVDIEFLDESVRATTLSVSSGGFGTLLARPRRVGDEAKVALRVPGGEPLRAAARVLEVAHQAGNVRASFELVGLDDSTAERLEMVVFDAILEQLPR